MPFVVLANFHRKSLLPAQVPPMKTMLFAGQCRPPSTMQPLITAMLSTTFCNSTNQYFLKYQKQLTKDTQEVEGFLRSGLMKTNKILLLIATLCFIMSLHTGCKTLGFSARVKTADSVKIPMIKNSANECYYL